MLELKIIFVFLLGIFGLVGYHTNKSCQKTDKTFAMLCEIMRVFSIIMIGLALTFFVAYLNNALPVK